MFNNKQNFASIIFIVASFFLRHLEANEIRTEFYPHAEIPKQCEEFCKGDCTVIKLVEWPPNRNISVTITPLFSVKQEKKSELTISSEASIMYIDSTGYTPGCPVTFIFQDGKKKELKKEITVVPNRLFVKSPVDNAQIEATIVQASPAVYNFQFTGFIENEELLFRSSSYDEQFETKLQLSKNILTTMPGVINKQGGIARLSFTRASGEILKLELPWGWEWMKYCMYYDENGETKSIVETDEFLNNNPKIDEYFRSKR